MNRIEIQKTGEEYYIRDTIANQSMLLEREEILELKNEIDELFLDEKNETI